MRVLRQVQQTLDLIMWLPMMIRRSSLARGLSLLKPSGLPALDALIIPVGGGGLLEAWP